MIWPLQGHGENYEQSYHEEALANVFGKEFLAQTRVERSETMVKLIKQPAEIKLIKGDYDILRLLKWRDGLPEHLKFPA